MPYERAKVYFDGSHYIAIPNSSGRRLKRVKSKNTTDGLQHEFEKIYAENIYAKRQERKEKCVTGMLSYMDKEKATEFVDRQFRRKQRNLIERIRKVPQRACDRQQAGNPPFAFPPAIRVILPIKISSFGQRR